MRRERESSGPHRTGTLLAAARLPSRRAGLCHTSCVRAIVLNSFTGPEGLEFAEVPDPMPG